MGEKHNIEYQLPAFYSLAKLVKNNGEKKRERKCQLEDVIASIKVSCLVDAKYVLYACTTFFFIYKYVDSI